MAKSLYILYFNGKIVCRLHSENLADATLEACKVLETRFDCKAKFAIGEVGASVAIDGYIEKGANVDNVSVHAIHKKSDVDHFQLFDKKHLVFVVNPLIESIPNNR